MSQRLQIIWFHLYERSREGKSIETENRLVVARGWGRGVTSHGYSVSFWTNENIVSGDSCIILRMLKNHWMVYFKRVNFSDHVWMWELDSKESWASKNRCFWTVVLEKTLESPLDCKDIQPVHPKGDQSLVFIGRTDVEAETPTLWPPDSKNWHFGKDPDAGKDWRWEEKGMTVPHSGAV